MTEIRERGNSVLFTFDNTREIPIPDPELMKELFNSHNIKFNAGKGDQIRWRIVLKHDQDQAYLKALGEFLGRLVSSKN